jgi:hypothetical protein
MPPEGVVVETDAPGGRLRLKWQGRLWRFPDESHYLFHTPRYWRPLAGPVPDAPRPAPPATRSIGRGLLALLGWMAGAGAAALAADLLMAPAPAVRQVALAVVLAAVGLALLFGGACHWGAGGRPDRRAKSERRGSPAGGRRVLAGRPGR